MATTNGYTTLERVRAEVGAYDPTDTNADSRIEAAIEAASRQIDATLGYRLYQDSTEVTREFYAESSRCVDLYEQPGQTPKAGISTTTNLVVKTDDDGDGTFETTLTINTDFVLWPPNAGDETQVCWTELRTVNSAGFPVLSNGRPGVQVTAKFGWSAVPDWAEQACVIQAVQLYKASTAPFGISTFGDVGGGLRVRAGLNPLADSLVRDHARPAVG